MALYAPFPRVTAAPPSALRGSIFSARLKLNFEDPGQPENELAGVTTSLADWGSVRGDEVTLV